MAHVVILGGGFGGLAAANELRSLLATDDRITLIARDESFFMGFAKLWDLARIRPLEGGTASLTQLASRGVDFVEAEVTAIDPGALHVETTNGAFDADAIVVALGGGKSEAHLGLLDHEHAHDVYSAGSLPAIHADLDAVTAGRVVVAILGGPFQCPPAPYEVALIVDERLRARGVRDAVEITVATPQPMTIPAAGPDASRYVAEHIGAHGIELLSEHVVAAVDDRAVTFKDGSTLDYSVLLGVPAMAPLPVLAASPLAGPSGFIHPDPRTLRTSFDRVYAVGDCTTVPNATGALPKAGVFAAGEALVAARNIAADLGRADGGARFDGHGYCFLELPGRQVAMVEGDFLAEPKPDVRITEASTANFERKQAYEQDRIAAWLG